jgi:NADH-quinone oxidoreductase subunit J
MEQSVVLLFTIVVLIATIFLTNLRNAVHSVFLLILVFANVGGILLILNIEFLALVYIIVYLGAIAVLFLFAVMMLNLKLFSAHSSTNYLKNPAILITVSLVSELGIALKLSDTTHTVIKDMYKSFAYILSMNALENLGVGLFLFQAIPFLSVGIILLLALFIAISLTLTLTANNRQQLFDVQVRRTIDAIRLL